MCGKQQVGSRIIKSSRICRLGCKRHGQVLHGRIKPERNHLMQHARPGSDQTVRQVGLGEPAICHEHRIDHQTPHACDLNCRSQRTLARQCGR